MKVYERASHKVIAREYIWDPSCIVRLLIIFDCSKYDSLLEKYVLLTHLIMILF